MAKKLQLRRGTTSQHSSFTGAVGEVTVDTDKNVVVVHDGSTAGGVPLAPSASPTFTGTVTIPSGASISGFAPLASPTLTGTPTVPGYATLASPTLTGTPASTTAAVSTNTTQIATTAFVVAEIADEVGTTVQAYDADTAKLDVDQTWTGAQSGSIYDATSDATSAGAGWAIDFADGNNQKVTLVSTNLLSVIPTNQTVGQSGSIFITQPGSPLSLGWHADWKWAGGTAPSLTQTGGATDRLDYVILAANTIHAVLTLAVA